MLRTRGHDCVILPVAQGINHLDRDSRSIVSSAPTSLTCIRNVPTTFSSPGSSYQEPFQNMKIYML